MAKNLTYNATITGRRDLNDTLALFRVTPDEPMSDGEQPFLPGQYVTAALPGPDGEWVQRPFSIASAPGDPLGIELFVRKVEHPVAPHPFSHLLFALRPGDRIWLRRTATGRFTLAHTIGEENPAVKLFVAGGTGLAPFMSMVRSRAHRGLDLSDIAVMHGARCPEELAFHEELMRLAMQHSLHYLASISRPQLAPEWKGCIGRVNELLRPERIDLTETQLTISIHPQQTRVFVCGMSDLISSTIEYLLPRGYVPQHRKIRALHAIPESAPATIFYEQYDDAPLVRSETSRHNVA